MAHSNISLSNLNVGVTATIDYVDSSCPNFHRLTELGFVTNTEIIPVHKSPTGWPIAYLVRGSVFGLRRDDAEKIFIRRKEDF